MRDARCAMPLASRSDDQAAPRRERRPERLLDLTNLFDQVAVGHADLARFANAREGGDVALSFCERLREQRPNLLRRRAEVRCAAKGAYRFAGSSVVELRLAEPREDLARGGAVLRV